MYSVHRSIKRAKIMAPVAWFIEPSYAEEYADLLKSKGIDARVIDNPDLYLAGEESKEGYDLLG